MLFLAPEYYVITFDEEGKAIDVREDLFVPLGGDINKLLGGFLVV